MHLEKLCLLQLLQLYKQCDSHSTNDVVVYHLYNTRKLFSPQRLRVILEEFVMSGFNPFSKELSPTAKVMMKSIIARCDSIIK